MTDRLFLSIPEAWHLCTSALSEVKELTPEFYSNPHFLRNVNNYRFGSTQDGRAVSDVELPAWAATPEEFIAVHREALESEYVAAAASVLGVPCLVFRVLGLCGMKHGVLPSGCFLCCASGRCPATSTSGSISSLGSSSVVQRRSKQTTSSFI